MRLLSPDTPLSFSGNRIGLLGGTFNPPHAGHVDASMMALRRLKLDRIWWLVTPGNPLKDNHGLPPIAERIALCRKLIADTRIVVTDFEQHLSDAYTANTITHLIAQRPTTNFVWLMGGDGLVNFHRWYHWQTIMGSVPIAVIDRPGWRLPAMSSRTAQTFMGRRLPEAAAAVLSQCPAPTWTYLTAPQNPLSSTALRQA